MTSMKSLMLRSDNWKNRNVISFKKLWAKCLRLGKERKITKGGDRNSGKKWAKKKDDELKTEPLPINESNKQTRVRSKASTSYKCCFSGCINNNLDSVKFHRIPPPPPPIPKDAKLNKIFKNKFKR